MAHKYADLSSDIKGKCVDYITKYLMKDFDESSAGKSFAEEYKNEDGVIVGDEDELNRAWISSIDQFLLFGETISGKKTLEVILKKAKGFTKEEKEILEEWKEKAFDSVFEIVEMDEKKIKLFNLVAEVKYDVYSNVDRPLKEALQLEERCFMHTNLVPIKGVWFLSGVQSIVPFEMEQVIFEDFIQKQPPKRTYHNNPEKLEKAFKLQKDVYDFFVDFYGSDEIIVPGNELAQKQREFYSAWNNHLDIKGFLNEKIFPEDIREVNSVGVVMDAKEGEFIIIDYGFFIDIFSKPHERREGWQKLIFGYLEDESVPAFVFERIKNRHPDGFRKVMSDIFLEFQEGSLDPVDDLDVLMNEYKPERNEVYPSVCPMNERFKKYYYRSGKVGRNNPCPCGSGKKYKKCCGR